jgi:hypothetical protein
MSHGEPSDPVFPNLEHVDPDNPFLALFRDRMPVRAPEAVLEAVSEAEGPCQITAPTTFEARVMQNLNDAFETAFRVTINEYRMIGAFTKNEFQCKTQMEILWRESRRRASL